MARRCGSRSSRSSIEPPVKGQCEREAAEASSGAAAPPPWAPIDSGWKPWKVVLGCFCLTVPTYGLLSSIGLFQTYWHRTVLRDHAESTISWIISVLGFLSCLFAAPAGILFDHYGSRWLLPLGCVVYVASLIGLSCASTYAQFMACMALAGVAAVPTTISFSVVSHWFEARKGLAIGCAVAVGQRGCRDQCGPPADSERRFGAHGRVPRADMFRVLVVSYTLFAYEIVLFIQWASIPSYAASAGAGNKRFYLMVSYNFGAVLGRTVPPWLSDRLLDSLNATISMNVFTLLVVLAIWMPLGTSSTAGLFVVEVLMGIVTGRFVPLGVSCIHAVCNPQNTGTWLGAAYSIVPSATLIGNPASAAILARYRSNALVAFLRRRSQPPWDEG
ncbi:major facilitator superfamily domain-containing protein [Chaetomium strumarium]|uniref:Major facilitator superfamily domain-containing protein n=1 Tax=Chaetomium strumarium TaxID=1170767 RepID=A0AAJ0M714_9PEZI|nr:major facilitator superfamily domain-containing protein [Chaetomium strumarium]